MCLHLLHKLERLDVYFIEVKPPKVKMIGFVWGWGLTQVQGEPRPAVPPPQICAFSRNLTNTILAAIILRYA